MLAAAPYRAGRANDHAQQRRPLESRCSTTGRNAAGVCCGDLFDVPLLPEPPRQRNDPADDGDQHRDDLQHQLECVQSPLLQRRSWRRRGWWGRPVVGEATPALDTSLHST